eukprot:14518860-Alexandrium_andersonii.AAC.1
MGRPATRRWRSGRSGRGRSRSSAIRPRASSASWTRRACTAAPQSPRRAGPTSRSRRAGRSDRCHTGRPEAVLGPMA